MSRFSFNTTPTISHPRSKFDHSHGVYTSMNVGKLVPLDLIEVLPGDTFDVSMVSVLNVSTAFLRPVKDNLVLDVYYFFCPSRIEFDKWGEIFGENNDSAWARKTEVVAPATDGKVESYTVGDYMGLVPGVTYPSDSINLIPFRGFADIYNEWFRNENIIDPMHVQHGSAAASEIFNNNPWSPNNYTGQLPNVSKRKDYFTSCLPSPQKGDSVLTSLSGNAPVTADVTIVSSATAPPKDIYLSGLPQGGGFTLGAPPADSSGVSNMRAFAGQPTGTADANLRMNLGAFITNASADLSGATAVNVNDLRVAVQTQKLLERAARSGTRYREYLLSAFGVQNGDSRMQVPEYLAGGSIPIKIQTVVQSNAQQQSSGGDVQSPLGRLAGFSETAGSTRFIKSFGEHGYIYVLGSIRQAKHSYQQGTPKMFTRKKQLDFYDPLFQSIGEQPVYTSEIYTPSNVQDLKGSVFGYNEAWAEYRFTPNKVTGQMRSSATDSFDIWHFGDVYDNAPTLSKAFIEENADNVDRTLAAGSDNVQNFLVDLYLHINSYRRLPVRSIPGYVDHY